MVSVLPDLKAMHDRTIERRMNKPVTVIVVNSLSFTGTTWLNAVLGAHDRTFALGPADRVFGMSVGGERARTCLVHGDSCEFWGRFWKKFDTKRNFFVQVAEHSGCDTLVTNNLLPDGAGQALKHPDIWVREIQFIRDGRAIAASHRRHQDGRVSFLDSVTDFLQPSLATFPWLPESDERLCIRYEDMLAEPRATLRAVGAYVGVDYDESALSFWKHEQHITSGNQGTIALIRYGQGLSVGDFRSAEFYSEQFQRIRDLGPSAFNDERWKDELSARERFYFDLAIGHLNEKFGYERDRFTLGEVACFFEELQSLQSDGALPENVSSLLAPRLSELGRFPLRTPEARADDCVKPLREQLSLQRLRQAGLHISAEQFLNVARLVRKAILAALLLISIGAGALALWSIL